jgi:hypothetical protein
MASTRVGRIRRVVGPRVRAFQAIYDAPTTGRLEELRTQLADLRTQLGDAFTQLEGMNARLGEMFAQLEGMNARLGELQAAVGGLYEIETRHVELNTRHQQLSRAAYDDLPALREKLRAVRASPEYAAAFEDREPLVSVPIATYNRAELLVERAVASVLAQTYPRWEIVVVGDGCTDDTAARIEALGDPRIRFVNLPFRTVYPDSPRERWLVAGAAPWNRAVELCRGTWVASLDDDDEFFPHHIEALLELALDRRVEFVCGKLEAVGHSEPCIFSFPPESGKTNMLASMYLRALDFFECDVYSWVNDEAIDWNLVRRMRDAGVLMAATEEAVGRHYPSGGN